MQQFLMPGIAGLACLLLAVDSSTGAYLESDGGHDDRRPLEIVHPPVPLPRPMPESANPVSDLIRRLEVCSPYRHGGLTVFPLRVRRASSMDEIRTLDEAIRNDWIVVREKREAAVCELQVRNDSQHIVFLMAGEIVAGGRQNRILREDVLLAPESGFVNIPVYCVEQDRWAGKSERFTSAVSMAHQELRRSAMSGASQDSIWLAASAKAASAGVSSQTRNYQDIYDDRRVKRQIDNAVSRFDRVMSRDTVGAVSVIGNRIVVCDLFGDPRLFSRLWGKLCRSYALEDIAAIDTTSGRWRDHTFEITVRDVERFLSGALGAEYAKRPSPSAGRTLQISGAVTGAAILWDSEAVHAVLFPGFGVEPMPMRRGVILE
ncbi:MAG: DUF6569 family protein [bacterium]